MDHKSRVYIYDWDTEYIEDNLVIHIFGMNEQKQNVCLHVYDFCPYFYVEIPTTRSWEFHELSRIATLLEPKFGQFQPIQRSITRRRKLFYYNPDIGIQVGSQISDSQKQLYKDIKKVSFMVFRTGSVLIVGRCDDNVIIIIYKFIKELLMDEYEHIHQRNTLTDNVNHVHVADKKKKTRKKQIILT